jgi:hypothetical protein
MVRVPRSFLRAGMAGLSGSGPARDPWLKPILRPPDHLFNRQVTVDIGNDGMAPLAVFAVGGAATAVIGPTGGGDLWSLDQCYLSTSIGQLDLAQCIVYAGPLPLPQYAVTASVSGGSSQFGMGGVGVPFGWFVWALWTGGTAGATANLRVTGTKTVLSN